MTGVEDLVIKSGIKKKDLRSRMQEANVPFSYNNHETFYNLINGVSRPRDPMVYIFLSHTLNVTLEEILLRYSETDNVTKLQEVVVKPIDKLNW
jgi:hypothetical protein